MNTDEELVSPRHRGDGGGTRWQLIRDISCEPAGFLGFDSGDTWGMWRLMGIFLETGEHQNCWVVLRMYIFKPKINVFSIDPWPYEDIWGNTSLDFGTTKNRCQLGCYGDRKLFKDTRAEHLGSLTQSPSSCRSCQSLQCFPRSALWCMKFECLRTYQI